jgi:opacity protein-like surface antigen
MDCLLALCLQASVGLSQVQPPPNSLWWEAGLPNSKKMQSFAYSIGVEGKHFKLGYLNLGNYSISSTDMLDEDAWKQGKINCIPPVAGRMHESHYSNRVNYSGCGNFVGNGGIKGIYLLGTLSLTPKLSLEVGPFISRNSWTETANWDAYASSKLGTSISYFPFHSKTSIQPMIGLQYNITNHVTAGIDYIVVDAHGSQAGDVPAGYRHNALFGSIGVRF